MSLAAKTYAHDAHCNTRHVATAEPCPPEIEHGPDCRLYQTLAGSLSCVHVDRQEVSS